MELTTPINLNLLEKLKKRSYFHKFFLARAKDEIAKQIRDLRKLRKLNQAEFAERAGMKQPAVSRIEQADYAGWNFKTLARVAGTLDVRLQIILTPMEDVINEYETAGNTPSSGLLLSRRPTYIQNNTSIPKSGISPSTTGTGVVASWNKETLLLENNYMSV